MARQLRNNKKSNSNKKVIVLIVAIIIAVIGTGIYFGFRVVQINYSGNKHYTNEEMNDIYLEHQILMHLYIICLETRKRQYHLYRNTILR